jgi:hypothetical protein
MRVVGKHMAKKRSNQLALPGVGRRGRAKVARVVRKKRKIEETHVAEKKSVASQESEAYGKLKEGIHIGAYTFTRAFDSLKSLLQDGRWKLCGPFEHVNEFVESLGLDKFKMLTEQRQDIVKLTRVRPEGHRAPRTIRAAVRGRQPSQVRHGAVLGPGPLLARGDGADDHAPAAPRQLRRQVSLLYGSAPQHRQRARPERPAGGPELARKDRGAEDKRTHQSGPGTGAAPRCEDRSPSTGRRLAVRNHTALG